MNKKDVVELKEMLQMVCSEFASHLDDLGKVYPGIGQAKSEVSSVLQKPLSDFQSLVVETLKKSIKIHHPRVFGHQVTAPAPVTVAASLLGDVMNYGMGVAEMGYMPAVLEEVVLQELGKWYGFSNPVGGVLTSGGSLGNLTALLVARNAMPDDTVFVYLKSAHYSNGRSLKILGIPEERIRKLHSWEDLNGLKEEKSLVLIASACSTALGVFDPISDLVAFAQKHGSCRIHVDAAHGGAAVFSEKLKVKLQGISEVDSLIFDFHKMALCPSLATAVIYKNPSDSFRTFDEDADYLFSPEDSALKFNRANQTIECTKPPLSLRAYAALHFLGTKRIANNNENVCDLAKEFAHFINEQKDMELACEPEYNIVAFKPKKEILNLREKILEQGQFYVTQTQVFGKEFLRLSLMNEATELNDLIALVEAIRQMD